MDYFCETIEKLKQLKEVDSIILGGSRATGKNDKDSDYDVYVYLNTSLHSDKRRQILEATCSYVEINNQYWETEDDCILQDGSYLEVIYRDMDEMDRNLYRVLCDYKASCGYTTCMCYNVFYSKILYDPQNKYRYLVNKYNMPYPEALRKNIIEKNRNLLDGKIPSYSSQIEKAMKRKDYVSVNHRITEFLASYFDIVFALNRMYHVGEKRILEVCSSNCEILPNDFCENVITLLSGNNQESAVRNMIEKLDKVIYSEVIL